MISRVLEYRNYLEKSILDMEEILENTDKRKTSLVETLESSLKAMVDALSIFDEFFPDGEGPELKRLFSMEIHESFQHQNDFQILKVPGGWIYKPLFGDTTSVFVPEIREYLEKIKGVNHEN